ncbi:transcription elongation factor GreB [Candidatus Berkiella cookevillensis]|uniref:Transcription elongation factor GreB n=1 Tax=Candidatus Berkiella cookevillensis TaxID=437022 RepID=A0A0Q9YLY1_9GAMM|nr:transcription elongation factor GreB [Candidatus Berkiella cookevillensis]MCS5709745.1 transcription elongation factor GreB [Candidatus Berkiella cookevillensis]
MKKNLENKSTVREAGVPINSKTYMTPVGYSILKSELNDLVQKERPTVVETVSWAASNGDRSENGDYIYGKKRLREIDRRIRYLSKRLENAQIVNSDLQKEQKKIFFGATVTYKQQDGITKTITIVGIDEADMANNKISYISPVAKALMKSEVGDIVEVNTPQGHYTLEIIEINY